MSRALDRPLLAAEVIGSGTWPGGVHGHDGAFVTGEGIPECVRRRCSDHVWNVILAARRCGLEVRDEASRLREG